MSRHRYQSIRRVLFTFAAAMPASAKLPAQYATKICPLGNSIIESFVGQPSPRYYLDHLLRGGGYAFDFVGSKHGVLLGPPRFPDFDQDHEGHSGFAAEEVLARLLVWIQNSAPDVVLMHLGTNDVLRRQSVSSTIDELAQCIDVIRSVNPYVTILVSQIIPNRRVSVRPLNAQIPSLVALKDSFESRVVVVDHFAALDPSQHLLPDGTHPTDVGEELMGQVWYDALRDFLTPASQAFVQVGPGCSGLASSVPALTPIRGQAASLGNPFTVAFSDCPPVGSSFGILGFSTRDFYGLPVPIELGVVGAPGCSISVAPHVIFPVMGSGASVGWTIEIPHNPVLVGHPFYQQGAFLDPSFNTLGLVLSNSVGTAVVEG